MSWTIARADTQVRPYGGGEEAASITQTDFGFTGQRNLDAQGNDFSLGLMDYHVRFYDPYLNRWTQPDTITAGGPQGLNRYSYVQNNPIRYNDPTGHRNCEEDGYNCPGSSYSSGMGGSGVAPAPPSGPTPIIDPCQIHVCGSSATIPPISVPTDPTASSTTTSSGYNPFTYQQGWEYFGDAVANCSVGASGVVPCAYASAWGGAHVVIIAGVIYLAGDAIVASGLACGLNPECEQEGYNTFNELKNALGDPGTDNAWHHIVEQSQIIKSGFSPQQIHSVENIIAIDQNIHAQISGFYSSIQPFTDGLLVRNWLAGQSFEDQYNFGIQVLQSFGVKIP